MMLSPPDHFHPAISHQRIFHRDTTNIAVIEAFIQRYKGTFYADLARARLEDLQQSIKRRGQVAAIQPSVTEKSKQPFGTVAPLQRAVLYDEECKRRRSMSTAAQNRSRVKRKATA
jgi:hypothetical protein